MRAEPSPLDLPGFAAPVHRALIEPILLGGAPRAVAIANATLAAAIGLAALFLRSLPRIGAFSRLVLHRQAPSSEGFVAASTEHDQELVGQEGVTLTYLRPVGVGLFKGQRFDVIAEGEFIEADKPIRIVAAHGNHILVRSV